MKLLFLIDNLQFFRDVFRSAVLPRLFADSDTEVIVASTYSADAIAQEFAHPRLRVHALQAPRPHSWADLAYSVAKDLYVLERPEGSFAQKRLVEAEQRERRSLAVRLALGRLFLAMGLTSRAVMCRVEGIGIEPDFDALLQRERPDLVIFSTMLPGVGPWLKAARKRGIPTVLSVASWDNPTSKGPLMVPPDHALAWSGEMKRELMHFHWLPAERITTVGVLYFESYFAAKDLPDRATFCAGLGIDPACRILHYATGDSALIRCNQEFIRVLQRLIASGQLGEPCHLLVRVSPKDLFHLYKEFEGMPHVTVQYPAGSGTLYGAHKWLPAAGEERERAATVKHSDVILSVSSSMVLDACCFDVPVINLAYDAGMKVPPWESVDRFFAYAHCQPALAANATWVVKDDAALLDALRLTLRDRSAKRCERRQMLERLVGFTDGRTNERWVDALRKLAAVRSAAPPN